MSALDENTQKQNDQTMGQAAKDVGQVAKTAADTAKQAGKTATKAATGDVAGAATDVAKVPANMIKEAAGGIKGTVGGAGSQQEDDKGGTADMAEKAAKDTAKAAKTVAKTAAKAASGNLPGAAAELAKDPKTTLTIVLAPILLLALIFFLVVTILFSIPVMIYEYLIGWFNAMGNKWGEIFYSNEHSGSIIANFCVWAFSAITSPIWYNIDVLQSDSETELKMMYSEAAEKLALLDRIYVVNEKLRKRAEQIKSAIKSPFNYPFIHVYMLGQIIATRGLDRLNGFCGVNINISLEEPLEEMADPSAQSQRRKGYNTLQTMYRNAPLNGTKEERDAWNKSFSDKIEECFPAKDNYEALKIITLMSVQKGASTAGMEDIEERDGKVIPRVELMRYLGWYEYWLSADLEIAHTNVTLGRGPTCKVYDWKGTFKPQYLMEEIKSIQDTRTRSEMELRSYQAKGDAEGEREAKNTIRQCNNALEAYKNDGLPLVDLLLKLDCPVLRLTDTDVTIEKTVTTFDASTLTYHTYITYSNPEGQNKVVLHEWYSAVVPAPTIYSEYDVDISIQLRDVQELNQAIGLWEGEFEDSIPALEPEGGAS